MLNLDKLIKDKDLMKILTIIEQAWWKVNKFNKKYWKKYKKLRLISVFNK